MVLKDTQFPDTKIVMDDSGQYVGVLTAEGIEASAAETPFLCGWRVLSSYDDTRRAIGQILSAQLGLDFPKGFAANVTTDDIVMFCTQMCPFDAMQAYLRAKAAEVSAGIARWNRERPWDTNPMTAAEAAEQNYVFNPETGEIGTDGNDNSARQLEMPSSIDGVRVRTILTVGLVSYHRLESLVIPDSVTRIEDHTFYDFIYLKTVRLPRHLRSIQAGTFSRCRRLRSVEIPDGVTEIGQEAFYQCSSLDTLYLPDSVEKVGSFAFIGVPHIVYHGTAPGFPWGATVGN